MYDSFVFDKKTFPFKRTSPLQEDRSQSTKTYRRRIANSRISWKSFITVFASRVSFKIPFEEMRKKLIEGMVKAVKSRHRSRKKVRLPVACCDDCPSNARGKRGKRARFEKQDVADERENFARDNYKYEAEKDVR